GIDHQRVEERDVPERAFVIRPRVADEAAADQSGNARFLGDDTVELAVERSQGKPRRDAEARGHLERAGVGAAGQERGERVAIFLGDRPQDGHVGTGWYHRPMPLTPFHPAISAWFTE